MNEFVLDLSCIGGVMIGSKQRLNNWYLLLFPKHVALRSKSNDWLARNQNNLSECSDMSIHGLLSQ
jgi:hypothetical protein